VRVFFSRGLGPDLPARHLAGVKAPTLLLVGGWDEPVIELNEKAREQMTQASECDLVIVPGATHLFEEPGKLEEVESYATRFFLRHL
jgi:putative phosphoribosyl transferase